MSNPNKEISNTVYIQGRTALGLTLGLACSIPLSTNAALAAGNDNSQVERQMQLNSLRQLRQERRDERRADRADRLSQLSVQNAARGANFNLSSGRDLFSANTLGDFQSLTIDVGGRQQVVTLDSKLSAAELVAAQQKLHGGVQTIELRGNGSAAGGTIKLDSSSLAALDKSVGGSIGHLTVARNVQVIDNNSGINLSGSLRNLGTISTASNVAGSTVTISADTINNTRSGSIGSYSGNDLFGADVALNAATSFTNNGSVSSAGDLSISAPVINNLNDGATASLSAGLNVNLNTQNLNNNGLIAAHAGDINVASQDMLNIVGTAGTMQASGNINLGATDADLNITGGDYLSQQLNLSAGYTGSTIEAAVGEVSGVVNAKACNVHVHGDSDTLNLGLIDAGDDPLITNAADIVLNVAPTGGAPLTVIAGGNITAAPGSFISTGSATNGGDVTLLAGVQFKTVGANVNVSKKSKTGGFINLDNLLVLDLRGTSGAGGDFTAVAFAGKNVGSGQVILADGLPIMTQSLAGAGNGDVLILGSAKTGTAIDLGPIDFAGNITVQSAVPSFSKGGLTFDPAGALVSGSFVVGKLTAGDININGVVRGTGDIKIGTTTAVNFVPPFGSIEGTSTDSQQITIQSGALNLNAGTSILSNDDSTLTITSTQPVTINGTISVGTLNLTAASLNITATGALLDKTDNITTGKGGTITVNGTLGRDPAVFDPTRAFTTFNINAGGAFVIGDQDPGAVVSGDGQITALNFTNNTKAIGNTTYTATGSGVAFTNNGLVDGQIVTITANKGTILNNTGAFLQATQQILPDDVPVLTLNTSLVNNLGQIQAVGRLKESTGTLNIASIKQLLITGVDGGFITEFNSTVNLSAAKGDVTVGGNDGVVNSNPFSALTTGLGAFSVSAAKGEFNTTMPGVTVTATDKGTLGTLDFTVKDIVYNGVGAAPNFALKAVGDTNPDDGTSMGIEVLNFNTTAKKGITIGGGSGEISVDITGYDKTSTTAITTPANLNVDTDFLILGPALGEKTGLVLTGTKNLLVTGDIVGGDSVTINTSSKKLFQIGNATTTGFNGLAPGEGVTANKTLTINGPKGFVMSGSSVLAAERVTLNGTNLEVQAGSDIKALDLTLNPGAATKVKYTNLNPLGFITAAHLNISTSGTLTLDSGGGNAVETFLTVGPDLSDMDIQRHEGGTFNLSASKLQFSKQGITFNAPGNNLNIADPLAAPGGGQVILNINSTKATRVGLGAGSIRAIVTEFPNAKFPESAGEFRLTTQGPINAKDVVTANVVQYGAFGPGVLELISSNNVVTVSGVSGFGYNLFHISTNSATPLLATDATKNGVLDSNTVLFGGNVDFENFGGKVVSNGVQISGVEIHFGSSTEIDFRKNAGVAGGFEVNANAGTPSIGGVLTYDAPLFTLDSQLGHHVIAHGGADAGAVVTINGQAGTQTLNVNAPNTGGAFSFDVSDFVGDQGNSISVLSGGAISANGLGFNYGLVAQQGSELLLTTGGTTANAKGFNLSFNNPSAGVMTGLDQGTVTLNSGSVNPFKLNGAPVNGNGFDVGNISAGRLIIAPQNEMGVIDTTGYQATVHDLQLDGTTINFANQTISVVADGAVGTGKNTGDGGLITVTADKFGFDKTGGVLLQAVGTGVKGGSITVIQESIQNLDIDADTFSFDVSNPAGVSRAGGAVSIRVNGDVTVDGNVFNYGAIDGGTLEVSAAGNMLVSNVANLSTFQLDEISFTNQGGFNKGGPFQFGGAGKNENGIADVGATLTANFIKIESTGLGAGIDTTGGTILANRLTLVTDGNVNFGSGSILEVAPSTLAGTLGDGGTINISAAGFTQSGGTAGYTISAAAGANGAGGIISISLSGKDTLTIGTNDLNIDISNFNGERGGSATVNNNGNIIADIANIAIGANFGGQGPNLSLNAKGILNVTNVDDIADVGFGGGNLTTATIGGVPTDQPPPGYTDSLNIIDALLPGGMVTITYTENPGDTNTEIAQFFADQIMGNTTLQSLLGLSATVAGNVITLLSDSNGTTYSETWTSPPPPADQQSPTTISLNSTTTGLTLTSQSSQPFLLGGAAPGTNGIQDNNLSLNIGAVTIGNTGSLVLLTVAGGSKGGTNTVTVLDPSLAGGFVEVSFQASAGATKETIAQGLTNAINFNTSLQAIGVFANLDGSSVELISTGVSTTFEVEAAKGSKLTLDTISSGGKIEMGTLVNIAGTITDVISLSASGDVGSASAPIIINGNSAQTITVRSGDDAYFSSNVGAGSLSLNTLGHTEATFSGGDVGTVGGSAGDLRFLFNSPGANANKVSLAGLSTTAGDLYIESDASILEVNGGLTSGFGNIFLQNTYAPGGVITIADGTQILGSGAVTALNQGNVYITIGLAPPAFTPADGVQPAGTEVIETGSGQVTFGSTAFPAGTIVADGSVDDHAIFRALGRDLVFSTGNQPANAITVGKNVVITADPPPLSAGVAILANNARTTSPTASSSTSSSSLSPTALEASVFTTPSVMNAGASNVVTSPIQSSSVNAPNLTIDSPQSLLSALSTINTIGLNNAQLSDLSMVRNAVVNAVEVSNNVGLLSNSGVVETASLSQTSETTEATDSQSRTLVGQVSDKQPRKLNNGPLLVAPENDMVVETPFGKVNIAAKTLALLVASEHSVAVYNLHDVRKGALSVVTNQGHTFNVTPGTSAVMVGSHDKSFEEVNPAQFVRYRKPVSRSLSNTHKLYRAEFEIISMLNGLPAFKELIQSENKETRKTMLNVLKTAAILMQLSGNAEPFEFFSKPEVTAMNNGR